MITVRRYGTMIGCGLIGVRYVVASQRTRPPTNATEKSTAANPIAKYAPSANAAMNTTAETSDRAELLIRSPEVLQRVGKQAHDDDACRNVRQDRNVHTPRVGVGFHGCRRSVKRDAAPHDDPNRAAIGHTAGAERQDRKSKLGTCEQVCKQIRVGFEKDADGARNEL